MPQAAVKLNLVFHARKNGIRFLLKLAGAKADCVDGLQRIDRRELIVAD